MQSELFPAPTLQGLSIVNDVIDQSEEARLVAEIDGVGLAPFRFQRWTGRRLTASFGRSVDFQTGGLVDGPPVPGFLVRLRERMAAIADVPAVELEQALLIRYDPGAGIGWHRDRPQFGRVVGVSLGAPADLRFRRRRPGGFDRASHPLLPRSAYAMEGEARHEWEHSILPMADMRWSVTFRILCAKPR